MLATRWEYLELRQQKLFFADLDPTFQVNMDPDPDPTFYVVSELGPFLDPEPVTDPTY